MGESSLGVEMRAQVGTHLCELHVGWVPQDGAVRLLVASIADELGVPDSEIVLAVDPLGKYGDGGPVVEEGDTWHQGGACTSGDIFPRCHPSQ